MATIAARFDPPHPMRVVDANNPVAHPAAANPIEVEPALPAVHGDDACQESSSPAFESAFAVSLPDDVREQLVRHANELSAHLRSEADHVDRREARLHARLAELEQQLRSASLYDFEQRAELDGIAEALEVRQRELEQRAAGIESAERASEAARLDIDRRLAKLQSAEKAVIEHERSLKDRERVLAEARQQLEVQSRRVGTRLVAQRDELDQHAAMIKEKLSRGMATLEQRRAALDQLQAQVEGRSRQTLGPKTGPTQRSA